MTKILRPFKGKRLSSKNVAEKMVFTYKRAKLEPYKKINFKRIKGLEGKN